MSVLKRLRRFVDANPDSRVTVLVEGGLSFNGYVVDIGEESVVLEVLPAKSAAQTYWLALDTGRIVGLSGPTGQAPDPERWFD